MAATPLANFVSGASAAPIKGIKFEREDLFSDAGVRGVARAVITD